MAIVLSLAVIPVGRLFKEILCKRIGEGFELETIRMEGVTSVSPKLHPAEPLNTIPWPIFKVGR